MDTVDILIVDDDAHVRQLLRDMLIGEDSKVTAVGSGADASSILRLSSPRILVTDVFMPDMDGLELIRAAREISPTTKIIAISGGYSGSGCFLRAAKAFGADAMLAKPFDRSELLDVVSALLKYRSISMAVSPHRPRLSGNKVIS